MACLLFSFVVVGILSVHSAAADPPPPVELAGLDPRCSVVSSLKSAMFKEPNVGEMLKKKITFGIDETDAHGWTKVSMMDAMAHLPPSANVTVPPIASAIKMFFQMDNEQTIWMVVQVPNCPEKLWAQMMAGAIPPVA